jgi:hypothetical protein
MYVVAVRKDGGPSTGTLAVPRLSGGGDPLGGTSAVGWHAGRWTYFLCCAVLSTYLTYLSFFSLKSLLFRYASDAVILACTALELLLAEGLRAVAISCAAYGIS